MIGVRLTALLDSGVADRLLAHELQELRRWSADASDELRRAIFSLDRRGASGKHHRRYSVLLRDLERSSNVQAHLSVSGTPTPAAGALHDLVRAVVNEALTKRQACERHRRAGQSPL